MTAPHFFVDRLEGASTALLSIEDSKHALRSLRLRTGEEVTLADGLGQWAEARFAGDEQGRAAFDITRAERRDHPKPYVSVALAPPKGDRLSWAIQKLAELGVEEAVLIETERSVRAWPADRAGRMLERQRTVAREASMQARSPFVMEVRVARDLDEMLCPPGSPAVLLTEGADRPLSTVLPEGVEGVRLLVGPEGGFSEAETRRAESSGANVASLGSSILRTETAAVVGAALVLAHYGRLG